MYGIWINENNTARRAKSKKEIKEHLKSGGLVEMEATSMFGNEFTGPATKENVELYGPFLFVGPNPYEKRNFYGSIKLNRKGEVTCE